MGVVYKARDERLDRFVALKFLPPAVDGSERGGQELLREARAASALDHPNIGAIHGFEDTPDGQRFIVMACYEGETLAQKIRHGPMSPAQAVPIVLQICRGLAEAHAHHIVHRDIKPSNTIVTPSGLVKIVDFGLARVVESSSATVTGRMAGTAAYMSPEQAMRKRVDHRTDLWSLGIVFHEMLSGRLPFDAESVPQLLFAIVHSPPELFLDTMPPEVQLVVLRALAKEPADRYQNAAEMIADLQTIPIADTEARTLPMQTAELDRYRVRASGSDTASPKPAGARRVWLMGAIAAPLVLMAGVLTIPDARRAVLGSLLGPDQKHIAVLPFTSPGPDAANAALVDGLMESLTGRLSNLEGGSQSLWVVPASEIRRRKVSDPAAARKEFGANLVITGTVVRQGQMVRLIVNLIDAMETRQIGSAESVDPGGDYARVQDAAVANLAKLLNVRVTRDLLRTPAGSSEPVAYESYLKGLGYLQRYDKPGNLDQAVALFEGATRADPKFALAFAGLGEAYLARHLSDPNPRWIDEAAAFGQRAARLNDELAPVHITLGRVHNRTGKADLALQEFQRALELDPRSVEALGGLASVHESRGRLKEAEETYRRATVLRPDYWDGYNSLGLFYYRQRRFGDAAVQLRKVIELTPDNTNAYLNLGAVLSAGGNLEDAAQAYQKAIRIAPTWAVYTNLGNVYYKQRRYAEAVHNHEQALKLNDKDFRPWMNLAMANRWLGRDEQALAASRRALPLLEEVARSRPQDAGTQSALGALYADLGQREKALSRLDTALALTPKDPSVLARTGEAYEALGNRAAAIEWVTRALAAGYSYESLTQSPGARGILTDPNFKHPTQSTARK